MNANLKKFIAEFLGVFVFLTAITGAVASGNPFKQAALALTLGLMILTLGPISGGHFNPAVSIFFFARRELKFGQLVGYVAAQLLGAWAGAAAGQGLWAKAVTYGDSSNQVTTDVFLGETLATAGLVFIIATLLKNRQANLIWISVATWVFAAGTFTVTGSQANPAVSFGLFFTGYGGGTVASLVVAQLLGLVVTILLLMILEAKPSSKKKSAPAKSEFAVSAAPAAATAKKPAAKRPAAKASASKATGAKAKPAAARKKPAAKK